MIILGAILTLQLLIHTDCVEEVIPVMGIQGGSVLLSPVVPPGFNPREVFWRHLSPVDHLVASFSRGSLDTTYRSCFHGRVELLRNFTLQISGLELKDTGKFTCQMVDTQGRMELLPFYLTVYEAASKPEVQVFVSRHGQDCSIVLSCNVTTGNNLSYSWTVNTGQGDLLNETHRLYDDKRLLQMTLTSTHQDVSFNCVVTNPVSKEHTSVVPWTSCWLAEPGPNFKVESGKIVLFIAASLIIMFTTGMVCVYLFTRATGKTQVQRRQKTNMINEETEALEDDQVGLQHQEETTTQQNGDTTLDAERNVHSNEERTVQFNAETTRKCKVETIV